MTQDRNSDADRLSGTTGSGSYSPGTTGSGSYTPGTTGSGSYTPGTTGATGATPAHTGEHVGTTGVYEQRDRAIPVRETIHPTTQRHEEVAVYRGEQTRRDNDRDVTVAVSDRHDGVRWGPVWAGLLTALTLFLLLELMFYAFGWLDLDPGENDPGSNRGLVTGILALASFFVGGLVAGATALWKGLFSGLLHGFLVWALGVVAFIGLTFFGASALLGSFGDLTSELGVGPQEIQSTTEVTESEESQAQSQAADAAEPAFWGLLAPLAASMLGGLIGSKIWPRKRDTEAVRVHE